MLVKMLLLQIFRSKHYLVGKPTMAEPYSFLTLIFFVVIVVKKGRSNDCVFNKRTIVLDISIY